MNRSEHSWWRRNRFGLLALPVAIALVVGANGIRLDDYWWNTELRGATTGDQGEFVRFHQEFSDALGETSRTLRVRLDGVTPIDEVPSTYGNPTLIPDGLDGYLVDLSFEAEPDQALQGCWLALGDDQGNRYEFNPRIAGVDQSEPFPCYVFGQFGPRTPVFEGDTREVVPGEERPEEWQTHPVVLVPEGAAVTQVLMWWEMPEHLSLRID